MGTIWTGFQQIIFETLRVIYTYVNDWGLAIIVLTILLRLVLTPLTIKQTKSMYEMQRVQPLIKDLQKKYADDKEKLQEETLKLYQDHKVNPFGGCLPLILQMPVFIALYRVLGRVGKSKDGLLMAYLATNHLTGSFYGIIPNIVLTPAAVYKAQGLVPALPYIILVGIFAVSVWLPQMLMPGGDSTQKTTGAAMAIMMLFFGWGAPAGVLLYWDVSSIWGIAQQQITTVMMKRKFAEMPAEIVVEKTSKKSSKNKKS
ncbi:MAG TPA: YidC/Oxa1 family membrane protein insertase [Coriobacteriia bacterium]|nr:YidC/Oxa1 family membrane protein insertase [Coriobacteriia bacterium]